MGSQEIKRLQKALDTRASDEPRALGYLQRLNLAGYDIKGQLSSAYGQSGVGVSIGAKIDFGALLVPFVHLDLGVNAHVEGTAHSVLVLHRMPQRLWQTDLVLPPQPPTNNPQQPPPPWPKPYWSSTKPLMLGLLRGKNFRVDVDALAGAWAGFGSPDFDETGLTVGVQATGSFGRTKLSRLIDTAPRNYPPTPSDSNLNEDVDDLFGANLKAKAAAWLIESGGGTGDLRDELGAARASFKERALDEAMWDKIEPHILSALDGLDKLAIPDVSAMDIADTGFGLIKTMAKAAKSIKSKVLSKKLVTQDLLDQLNSVSRELDSWVRYLSDAKTSAIFGSKRRTLYLIAKRRLAEANDLIAALKRRKAQGEPPNPEDLPPLPVDQAPPCHLDIMVSEWRGKVSAGTKFILPRELVTLKLVGSSEVHKRTISFRHQSSCQGLANSQPRTLLSSQDTVITYLTRKLKSVQGQANSHGFLRERPNLVTMSYRSAIAFWFDDLAGENHKALPNGSGVCFGMSVLAGSLAEYARACKMLKKPPPGQAKLEALDAGLQVLEEAMCKQLRVSSEALRKFMRRTPSSTGKVALEAGAKDGEPPELLESYLVESAFAYTKPTALTVTNHRPESLFDLGAVKTLEKSADPGTDLRLQAIRLRIRIRSDDDTSSNLIRLGWNPEPWGDEGFGSVPFTQGNDAKDPWYVRLTGVDPSLPNWLKISSLALELGIGVERVRRAGSEGIFEYYQRVFPDPFDIKKFGSNRAREMEARANIGITEMLVPPVALFNY